MTRISLFFLFFLLSLTTIRALNTDSLKSYSPHIEGTIRAKYEYNTGLGAYRFQVRNARFSINGNFSPIIFYKAEIDLSDEGKTKMLDAYIRAIPAKWFTFTLGQQKIPFSTDNLRSPHYLYFANRSFIGKQITGLRDVGATAMFINKNIIPCTLQLGIYNGDGLYDQQNWQKEINYTVRLEAFPVKSLEISLNYNSIQPDAKRMYYVDAGAYLQTNGWHFDTEFVYKKYEGNFFPDTKAFFVFGAYDIKINKPNLLKITPVVRYDIMTNNNKGLATDAGNYVTDHIARSRFTGGVTLSFNKPFLNDLRLNYEKYFYENNINNIDDKIVAELIVRF
ncbi:MAG: porin [Paludibacteraceae bacterium]